MSTDRIHGKVVFLCDADRCHETLETDHREFIDASEERKREGWSACSNAGEWKHFCPGCRGART